MMINKGDNEEGEECITVEGRYGNQGQLQLELTEKLIIAIEYVDEKNKVMFADDIYSLLSLAVNNSDLSDVEKWESINSRAGMYLNNYLPKNKKFPEHVMKELAEMDG